MRRASKGTPSSSPAQDRSLCQPRCWQQYHPTRDVAESLPAAPSLIVSSSGLYPSTKFWPFWGWDPLCSIPWGAGGGRMGLCCPRRAQRAWEAAGESRGHSKGPPPRKGGKSREKILQNESGVRKPRPELSCCGRPCSLYSHGNRSDALQLGCFLSSFLKEERSGSPFPGRSGAVPGHRRDSWP